MTHGTHLHSDFACRAPSGTCAPMSVIDNAAVAGMGAMIPAGSRASLQGGAVKSGPLIFASTSSAAPQRTSDRVLKVVFPAYVDATGTFHEESIARTVVERGGWVRDVEQTMPGTGVSVSPAVAAAASPTVPSVRLASLDEAIAAVSARAKAAGVAPANVGAPRIAGLAEAVGQAHAETVDGLDPDINSAQPEVVADARAESVDHVRHHRGHVGLHTRVSSNVPVALDAARINYAAELNRLYAARYQAPAALDVAVVRPPTLTDEAPIPASSSNTMVVAEQAGGQPR